MTYKQGYKRLRGLLTFNTLGERKYQTEGGFGVGGYRACPGPANAGGVA